MRIPIPTLSFPVYQFKCIAMFVFLGNATPNIPRITVGFTFQGPFKLAQKFIRKGEGDRKFGVQ